MDSTLRDYADQLPAGYAEVASAEYAEAARMLREAARRIETEALPTLNAELADQINDDARERAQSIMRGETQTTTDALARVTEGNLRVEGDEEREEPDPCEIGPYSAMSRKCGERGGQAHHIVPDYTLRTGPRPAVYAPDPYRIRGAPTLAQGMAICLSGQARARDGEHFAAHRSTDLAIAEAGVDNAALPGTATWDEIRDASLEGIRAAKPECYDAAVAAVDTQFAGVPGDRLLRAEMDFRNLPDTIKLAPNWGARLVDGQVVNP